MAVLFLCSSSKTLWHPSLTLSIFSLLTKSARYFSRGFVVGVVVDVVVVDVVDDEEEDGGRSSLLLIGTLATSDMAAGYTANRSSYVRRRGEAKLRYAFTAP